MAIDWFGFKKRQEAKKEVLKREIRELISGEQAESSAMIQNWDTTDQTQGRDQRVSYRTLEQIYKKESWVRAGIDAIQRTATSNGFRLVTKDDKDPNELTERETIRIMKLLRNPNSEDSFSDIISEIIVDLHLYGDAYIEVVKDDKGIPIAIYNIYAPSIKVLVNRHGTVLGYIQNVDGTRIRAGKGEPVIFDPNELVHFKLPNPGNEVYGLSPIESLFIPIETDLHAQNYNLTFFKNNATPKLHIDLGNCTLPQLKRTKEFFKREYLGQPHKTLITEGGAKVSPIGTKPADMEFLNQRKFSRDEILAVLGVPPMKVGITEDVNRACLPSETLIATPKGYKKLIDIKPGDKVYSVDINKIVKRKVKNLFHNGKQKVYEVKLNDRKIQATDNHPFLTVKVGKTKRGIKASYTLVWKQLKDLEKGDFVVCTNTLHKPSKTIHKVFKKDMKLTEDFMELIGLYIGDGSITKNNQGKLSEISWAIEEGSEIRKYYEDKCKKVFNTHINKNKHVFRICSIKWGKIFKDLDLAHNVYTKKIPEWVWSLDRSFQMAFFRGLIESDGTVSKRGAISYSSCNENLIRQIKLLTNNIGIPSFNIYKYNRLNDIIGFKTNRPLYRITFENHDINKTLIFRTSTYNNRIKNTKKARNLYKSYLYKNAESILEKAFMVRRVVSKKFTKLDLTYDLEIEDTHNYIAEGIVVHNSALESDKSFKSDKIIPLQRMLAKKINLSIISLFNEPRVQLEFAELDLRDAKEQAEIDKTDIESGIITVDEARKKRGLPPKEELNNLDNPKSDEEIEIEENLNFLNEKTLEPKNGKSKKELSLYFR